MASGTNLSRVGKSTINSAFMQMRISTTLALVGKFYLYKWRTAFSSTAGYFQRLPDILRPI
ncbi:MAG TPA: hypothetical protein V6D28_22480 [Leptolyngbyaceae cyanobacterium]